MDIDFPEVMLNVMSHDMYAVRVSAVETPLCDYMRHDGGEFR